jgi:hypothetical protein
MTIAAIRSSNPSQLFPRARVDPDVRRARLNRAMPVSRTKRIEIGENLLAIC